MSGGNRVLRVTILGDASGAKRAMSDTEASAGSLLARFDGLSGGVGKLGTLLTGALGGAGFAAMNAALGAVGSAFGGLRSSIIGTNADLETSAVTWGVLLGSTERADAKLRELQAFAATTPFEFPGVQKASLLLQTFGGDALNTAANLTLIGDVAAGVNQPFEDVAMWTARMYDAFKSGQPFGEASARLQEMGAMSGETRLKLEQMQKAGASAEQMWAAFSGSMGRFGGMMDKQSKTFSGQMSTMRDSLNMLAAQAGKPLFAALTAGLGKLNAALGSDRAQAGIARLAAALQGGLALGGRLLTERVIPALQLLFRTFAGGVSAGSMFDRLSTIVATAMQVLGRGFQLGVDGVVTFKQALSGDWTKGGAGNDVVNLIGRIGLAIGDLKTAFDEGGFGALFGKLWADYVQPGLTTLWTNFTAWIGTQGPLILTQLGEWAGQFGTWAKNLWTDQVVPGLGQLWRDFDTWIVQQTPLITGKLAEWGGAFVGWAEQTGRDLWGKLTAALAAEASAGSSDSPLTGLAQGVLGDMNGAVPSDGVPGIARLLATIDTQITTWGKTEGARIFKQAVVALLDAGPTDEAVKAYLDKWGWDMVARIDGWVVSIGLRFEKWVVEVGKRFGDWLIAGLNSTSDRLAKWLDDTAADIGGKIGSAIRDAFLGGPAPANPTGPNGLPIPGPGPAPSPRTSLGGTALLGYPVGGAGLGGAVTIQSMTFAPVINGMTYPEAGRLLADDFMAALNAAAGQGTIMPAGRVD